MAETDMKTKIRYLIEAIRGGGRSEFYADGTERHRPGGKRANEPIANDGQSLSPLSRQNRGYKIYVAEAQANGEPVLSYREWSEGGQ